MSESHKAGSVILANLAMFNESVVLFEEEIQPVILKALDETIEGWASTYKWTGLFDFVNGRRTWIFPAEWHSGTENESDSIAWFDMTSLSGEGDSYELADLCTVGQDEMGFIFYIKHSEFGGKLKWNKFCKTLPVSISSRLQALSFNDVGLGVFTIPIRLNPNLLACAWENEGYEEVMQPVIAVLENIREAIPIFDEMFSLAKAAGLARV